MRTPITLERIVGRFRHTAPETDPETADSVLAGLTEERYR